MNRLLEIVEHKRKEIEPLLARAEKLRYAAAARNDFRPFQSAIDKGPDEAGLRLIAEVKKASPSAGTIAEAFDPVAIGTAYAAAGASAISVLTDEKYFQGRLDYMTRVREAVAVPVLRKDFIVHEAQIWEAVVAGADAILLIVAALSQDELVRLLDVAHTYQLDVLVEVHDLPELERALETDARIIGINNRNLKTFEVDLHTTERLSEQLPDDIVLVSESGIKSGRDARSVESWGADAILVGESLMRTPDVPSLVRELMDPTALPEIPGA